MKKLCCENTDMPFEIFSRLPAKDLYRAKWTCKEWRSLISDRTLIRLQLKKTEPLSGFFFQEKFQWTDIDISQHTYISLESSKLFSRVFSFLPVDAVLLSSCNGLICCRSCLPSPKPALYVCNPLNKDWMSLEWTHPSRSTSAALVFDPCRSPIGDALTKFQVVTLSETETETEEEESEFTFDIYSSETGKWRRSAEKCQCKHELFKNKGIFVAGLLYWLTNGDEILMFDPEFELSCLINMPLPFSEFQTTPEVCIGESNGELHYVLLSEQGLQLWVLKEPFASQWDLTLSISLQILEEENSNFLYQLATKLANQEQHHWMDLLSFEDDILLLRAGSYIYTYHFRRRKMERLCDISELGKFSMYSPTVLPYSMSLAPVRSV